MTVRPVDMHTMIPRLNEAGRQQHYTDTQPVVVQQVHAATMQAKAVRAQQQVNQNPVSERVVARDQGQRQGREQERSRKGQSERRPDGGTERPTAAPAHQLDVKV